LADSAKSSTGTRKLQDEIDVANKEAVDRMNRGNAVLTDFERAKKVIPGMTDTTVLYAGPPISYPDMIPAMKVAVQGALILEGMSKTLEQADKLASSGDITFSPCHEHSTVGPMAGVTTASMYVAVIENQEFGIKSYCNLHEGRGKILRFGGYDDEVLKRLRWMNDDLGPSLKAAVKTKPINLKPLISQGLLMGDEFHQRFNASSLLFLQKITELLIDMEHSKELIGFISEREQFFLNLAMPAAKAIADAADGIEHSTVVTRLTRNGVGYGIGVSGLKGQWFVGPAEVPKGLFFAGYSEKDAAHDFGDSAIVETVGLGGYASAAAPAVTRFIGGNAKDAMQMTMDGYKVCAGTSRDFLIPATDFRGVPLGIDILKVNETGIVPKSNTGIAAQKPGVGQIGAGVSKAPIEAFRDALRAYAKKYGL